MKSEVKYLIVSILQVAMGGAWLIWGMSLRSSIQNGFAMFLVWLVLTLTSAAVIMFGGCILYELGKMWYKEVPLKESWAAHNYRKFKAWMARDGLK